MRRSSQRAVLVGLVSLLGAACWSADHEKQGPAKLDGDMPSSHDGGHDGLDASDSQADPPASPDGATDSPDVSSDAGGVRQARVVDDPWCVAPSASSSYGFASWAGQIAAAGVGWVRSFDGSQTANALKTAAEHGLSLSGIYWYSKGSPGSFPVDDLPGFRGYVSDRLSATNGKVLHWEVWNEPPNFSEDKSPVSYAQTVIAAYDRTKQESPAVQVGLAAQSNNVNFLAQALAAGAADHFDYVTLHPYETLDLVHDGWEAEFMAIVPTLRKMLAAKSPSRVDVPVWFTELGQPVGGAVDESQQADTLVKAYVMGLAQGVARVCWFEILDGDSGPFGLIASAKRERPSYKALATLVRELGKQVHYAGWLLLDDEHYGFVFEGAGEPKASVLVIWAGPHGDAELSFDTPVRVVEPKTQLEEQTSSVHLTSSPVMLVGVPESWVATAYSNQARPFPWGGDFSNASSVSYEAPGSSAGLHPLGAAVVRSFAGVQARDISGGPGQAFTVDPNFSSYGTESLKITAVVRRNGADNAGFNLKYESTSGWKGGDAWFTVPAGDAWTTHSWTITDPQFVGKWGYNFSFDSDSTMFSKYSIRSVKVEKL